MPQSNSFLQEKKLRYIQRRLRVSRQDILSTLQLCNTSIEKIVSCLRHRQPGNKGCVNA